ncbi:MAG: galactosyldiacylglycerol synthase [Candidatus Binatia bacterium]
MVKLHNKDTGVLLGTITEEQLQFLIDQLEEESSNDTDYYLDQTTLEMFEQAGADASLLSVLRKAIGERESIEIRWSRD